VATITYPTLDALLTAAPGLQLYMVVSPDGNVRRCLASSPDGTAHTWNGDEADAVKQGDPRIAAAIKVQNLET